MDLGANGVGGQIQNILTPPVGKNKAYLAVSILSLVKDKSDFLEINYFFRSLWEGGKTYDFRYCAQSLSRVQLFVTPWAVARQAPPSMEILQARILE